MNMQRTLNGRMVCAALLLIGLPAWAQTSTNVPNRPARVALLSDLHVTRGTKEEQPFHQGRLERALAAVNAENVDLVLIAGDLTENGTRTEFADLRKQLQKLRAPVWYVPGNHDLGGKVVAGKKTDKDVTPQRVDTFEWRMGSSWFSREQACVRVIGLNASLFGSGLKAENAMWQWLENELAQPAPQPTLLLMHYPPFTQKPNEPGGVYWNLEPQPRQRLLQLAHQGGVRAILSGHVHTENVLRQDGILFVTTPPVAFGLPKGRQYRGWTLLTVTPQGEVQSEFRYLVD